jgi:hypothetical protein
MTLTEISREGNKTLNSILLRDNIIENTVNITPSDIDQVSTAVPRRSPLRFPPRLLQLLISLRRECFNKMSVQPTFDKGKVIHA